MRLILGIIFSVVFLSLHAGVFGGGVMVGANSAIDNFNFTTPISRTDSKLGYNFNIFLRFKLLSFLIQPEFGYTLNRSGFTILENTKSIETTLNHGEIYNSVLLGYKLGTIRFMGGPIAYSSALEDIKSSPFSTLTLMTETISPSLKWGGQVGLGLDISKQWTIDARFQKIFTSSVYTSNISNAISNFEGSLGSISLSLGYSFFRM